MKVEDGDDGGGKKGRGVLSEMRYRPFCVARGVKTQSVFDMELRRCAMQETDIKQVMERKCPLSFFIILFTTRINLLIGFPSTVVQCSGFLSSVFYFFFFFSIP